MRLAGSAYNVSTMKAQYTKGNIASPHCSRGFSIGTARMRSFVVIFVPCRWTHGDAESVLREHTDSAEFVEAPDKIRSEPVEDAEQLPLWRWFTF